MSKARQEMLSIFFATAVAQISPIIEYSACSFECSVQWGTQSYLFNQTIQPQYTPSVLDLLTAAPRPIDYEWTDPLTLVYSKYTTYGTERVYSEILVEVNVDGSVISIDGCLCANTNCTMTVCTNPIRYHALQFVNNTCNRTNHPYRICNCIPELCPTQTTSVQSTVPLSSSGSDDSEATSDPLTIFGCTIAIACVAFLVGYKLYHRDSDDEDDDFNIQDGETPQKFYSDNSQPHNIHPPSAMSYPEPIYSTVNDLTNAPPQYEIARSVANYEVPVDSNGLYDPTTVLPLIYDNEIEDGVVVNHRYNSQTSIDNPMYNSSS